MKSVSASKFKAQCLSLLDRVTAQGIVITKHGRPVAKLLPADTAPSELIGSLKGKLRIRGRILSTDLAWDAQSRHAHPPLRARR